MLRRTLLRCSAVALGCTSVLAHTNGKLASSVPPSMVAEQRVNRVGAPNFPVMMHRILPRPETSRVPYAAQARGRATAEPLAGKSQALMVSGGGTEGSNPAGRKAVSPQAEADEPRGMLSVLALHMRLLLATRKDTAAAMPDPRPSGTQPTDEEPVSIKPYLQALGILGLGALGSGGLSRLYVSEILASSWVLPIKPWQLLPPIAYLLNLEAVGLPGRLDGRTNRASHMSKLVRFFSPASWAFGIWAPIFLGETAYVLYQLLPLAAVRDSWWLEEISTWFAGAMLFQILWCFSFRPWAMDAGMLWLPTLMLGGAGVALRGVYEILHDAWVERDVSIPGLIVAFLPLSLHFGWISCATLVNANGYVATFTRAPDVLKLVASVLSVVAAVSLSIVVTAAYESPIYGTVVAWALWAVGSRAGWRNLEGRVDPRLIRVQELAAKTGSILSLLVAYTPLMSALLESLSKLINGKA